MGHVESLQAMLERRLIRGLVQGVNAATTEDSRRRRLMVLRDFLGHTDPSLDTELLDAATRSFLQRAGLWIWSGADTEPDGQATDATPDRRAREDWDEGGEREEQDEREEREERDTETLSVMAVRQGGRRITPPLHDGCSGVARRSD